MATDQQPHGHLPDAEVRETPVSKPADPVRYTFTTAARHGDWEGEVRVQASTLNLLRKSIRNLPAAGFTPISTPPTPHQWACTPEGLPICPKHQEPMPKRERQGDTWYSHTVQDPQGHDVYCRGYPSKRLSPGWEY